MAECNKAASFNGYFCDSADYVVADCLNQAVTFSYIGAICEDELLF